MSPASVGAVRTRVTPGQRLLITCSVMLSTMIVALDGTIANVALPHMQSSLLASPEQVVWVLTSYLVASAIMTPLASWLASRFGRKRVMTLSAACFTLSSLACGLAGSLEMMVVARLLQGISGAGLIPLGQATLLDIYPPEKQGKAMAIAGLGAMLGPLTGPTLGGWLTDVLSWRWVFLINIPIGIMAFVGLSASLVETRDREAGRFDMLGFATISIFLGAFQLMMDRGQHLDWFDSPEIWVEAALVLAFGYLTVIHMLTARNTFVRAEVFVDRNFSLGSLISAVIGVIIFATVPLLAVAMQAQLGYTAFQTGLVSMPRGVGTVIGLILVSHLLGKIDARILLFTGLVLAALSLAMFAGISLDVDQRPLMIASLLQGFGGGLMIAPLSTLVFSTLAPHLRNEGAAIYALARNIGNSLGISVLQAYTIQHTAAVTARLAEGVRPDSPVMHTLNPDFGFESVEALAGMAGKIGRQAAMVATVNAVWATCLLALAMLPVVLMLRGQKPAVRHVEGPPLAADLH